MRAPSTHRFPCAVPLRSGALSQSEPAQGLRNQLLPAESARRQTRREPGDGAAQQPGRRLGTRFVPPDSFTEDVRVPHLYNRLLLYTANMMHGATGYWGSTLEDKRMTAVFFWMA